MTGRPSSRRRQSKREQCSCGALEGQFHEPGCDMELCPFCRGQLLGCSCVYDKLGLIDRSRYGPDTAYLPPFEYHNGLSQAQSIRWDQILRAAGLVPFIQWPVLCSMCGGLWPEFFRVPDDEWRATIPAQYHRAVICRPCYETIQRDVQAQRPVIFPEICAKCGRTPAEPLGVSDSDLRKYVQWPIYFDQPWQTVLCAPCFSFIRQIFDLEHPDSGGS